MTYSIVARDPASGQMGVAVQTFNLAVGAWVPWAEGGVGAVATQGLAERSYGTEGLQLMAAGRSPSESLTQLVVADPKREFRQVSMVDHRGRVATRTGDRCFPAAGSVVGEGFCTQANMMARDTVWGAMAEAYRSAAGDLADRLLAALQAAEAEGGDLRGRQSAALLVVDGKPTSIPIITLRVDHDPEPLAELRRLLRLQRAYTAEYAVPEIFEAGDEGAALQELQRIGEWAPNEPYLQYLRALHLAARFDRWEESREILSGLMEADLTWQEYLRREAQVDNFGVPGLGARLLETLDIEEDT